MSFTEILENLTTVYIGHPYLNILWFMVNLLQLYFFIPVLQSTFLYSKKVFYSFFACVSVFVFLSPTMSVLKNLVGEIPLLKGIWMHLLQFNFLGNGVFVFYAMYGAIVRDLKDRLKPRGWIPLGIVASLVCILYGVFVSRTQGVTFNTGFVYDSPFAPFMVMLFYMLAGLINQMIKSERVVSAVQMIGANTLGIYFCHLLIIFELYTLAGFSGENMNLAVRFLFSVFILFASMAVVKILKKIPVLRELV
ncbi:acyltransferase family protein [Stomatobaculum longum]|uniref:acyltransferase family protein n=1 Tax=Stomatobaculum longum TaxID=796942 RepID=UPI0028EC6C28|nr:acyltransferase family protein [Stomatobaculum longum]